MASKAKVMVNEVVNVLDHANVLIGHADALIRENASITVNIGTIIGIITVSDPAQGNGITGARRSIMMTDTSIGSLNPDGNGARHTVKIAIVVNIAKKNVNDLGIEKDDFLWFLYYCSKYCKV